MTIDIEPKDSSTIFPESNWYDSGSQIQIFAKPKWGYSFQTWSTSGNISIVSLTSEVILVKIKGPGTIIARMKENTLQRLSPIITIGILLIPTTFFVIQRMNKIREKKMMLKEIDRMSKEAEKFRMYLKKLKDEKKKGTISEKIYEILKKKYLSEIEKLTNEINRKTKKS